VAAEEIHVHEQGIELTERHAVIRSVGQGKRFGIGAREPIARVPEQ
jgi:hypothetical protein|tara:strand:- start:6165 stop:6302 length:138 start_codon:yes stop_codon:yes gene_type:complete